MGLIKIESENWLAEFETRNIQATTLISQSTKSGRAKEQRVHMHGREVKGKGKGKGKRKGKGKKGRIRRTVHRVNFLRHVCHGRAGAGAGAGA